MTTIDSSFLSFAPSSVDPTPLLDNTAYVVANANDVFDTLRCMLDALGGMELDSTIADMLRELEASVAEAMEAARETKETCAEYVAACVEEFEAEEESEECANSEIDYALDYYDMLD
jgi:1,6-anhydro-N-acetylmuramate kinase